MWPAVAEVGMAAKGWVLASEPDFVQVLVHFPGNLYFVTRNEAQKQHSLLDTIFDYIFYFGPPGSIYKKVKKTYYMLAGFAGQHVVSCEDLNIDSFLEVQNKRYSKILYLIDYVVPGFHFQ